MYWPQLWTPKLFFVFSQTWCTQEYILIWGNYELNKWNLWKLNKKTKVEISISILSKKKQKVIFQRNLNLNKYTSFCKIVAAKCNMPPIVECTYLLPRERNRSLWWVTIAMTCHIRKVKLSKHINSFSFSQIKNKA